MLRVQQTANGQGKSLTTTVPIRRGTAFHQIRQYRPATEKTYTSVQIDINYDIEEFYLAHLNHSCEPNVIIDTTKLELRAIRDIERGEDLTFFYPSTEWQMAEPFQCLCGSTNCLGKISGARDLSLNVLGQYFINQHIGAMAMEHLLVAQQIKTPIAV
ncbi:MAG: SET domain-containing methyltransferase [Cyanobacteria bacterium P01_H01_bin.153]